MTTTTTNAKPAVGILIRVTEENRGRVTGWGLSCRDCGMMPVLAPSREAGREMAIHHRGVEHGGRGVIQVRPCRSGKGRGRAA